MTADLPHAVSELPDDAFARDVVAVGLGIGRVGEFDAPVGGDRLEAGVVGRRTHLDGVPRLGFDLQPDPPFGMRGHLVGDEAGFPGDRVVAVDAPVVSVDEINPLLGADGGARCEQEQGQAQRRYDFRLPAVRCAVPHIPCPSENRPGCLAHGCKPVVK